MNEKPETITELYETVVENIMKCETPLLEIKTSIEGSELLKTSVKNSILSKIQTIFDEANAITDKIGRLGKVN